MAAARNVSFIILLNTRACTTASTEQKKVPMRRAKRKVNSHRRRPRIQPTAYVIEASKIATAGICARGA